jgi:hypothetical protein
METNFVPGEPSVAQLVRAVKLLVADFDGRPTSRVTGTGGRPFEFYPTTGFRSKVVQVHLGDMPAVLAEAVSEHFPAGFCRLGSGEPRS